MTTQRSISLQKKARMIAAGIIAVAVITGVWRMAEIAQSRNKMEKLADEFSSIISIQKAPVINHAGNLIGLIHSTDRGMGIFIAEAGMRKEQKLSEVKDQDYINPSSAITFGWSPNEKLFAYSWSEPAPNQVSIDQQITNLYFWNGNGTEMKGKYQLTNGITAFAWLTDSEGAFLDNDGNLILLKNSGNLWHEEKLWALPAENGAPRSLISTGTNSLAWLTDNSLWQMQIQSGEIKSIVTAKPYYIDFLSYCKETDEFLLAEVTNRAKTSLLVAVKNDGAQHEVSQKYLLREAQWINDGRGFAGIVRHGFDNFLVLHEDDNTPDTTFFSKGGAGGIVVNGNKTYVFAQRDNEPPGVWLCDGQTMKCLYSAWDSKKYPLHFQPTLIGYAPMANKHNARFELIPPANFSRQKKYPLVIGMTGYDWMQVPHAIYIQCMANSGAYVAMTDYRFRRDGHEMEDAMNHTNNILTIYDFMARNPNVDTSRVYLFGYSMSTMAIAALLKEHPGLFKGIMLINPGELPEPKEGMTQKLLLTGASSEGQDWTPDRMQKIQEDLYKVGIPMTWFIHEDCGHIERAQHVMRERSMLMMETIFDE